MDELKERKVKIILYGEEAEVTVPAEETILTACIDESLDPPFSCQIGVCSVCRARLISGKVEMDDSDALTNEEIEAGYIITCQSYPLTDDVKVDFDQS